MALLLLDLNNDVLLLICQTLATTDPHHKRDLKTLSAIYRRLRNLAYLDLYSTVRLRRSDIVHRWRKLTSGDGPESLCDVVKRYARYLVIDGTGCELRVKPEPNLYFLKMLFSDFFLDLRRLRFLALGLAVTPAGTLERTLQISGARFNSLEELQISPALFWLVAYTPRISRLVVYKMDMCRLNPYWVYNFDSAPELHVPSLRRFHSDFCMSKPGLMKLRTCFPGLTHFAMGTDREPFTDLVPELAAFEGLEWLGMAFEEIYGKLSRRIS